LQRYIPERVKRESALREDVEKMTLTLKTIHSIVREKAGGAVATAAEAAAAEEAGSAARAAGSAAATAAAVVAAGAAAVEAAEAAEEKAAGLGRVATGAGAEPNVFSRLASCPMCGMDVHRLLLAVHVEQCREAAARARARAAAAAAARESYLSG
jgi:hypothetical protein